MKTQTPSAARLIDSDIHHEIRSTRDLLPYLSDQWKRYITDYGWVPERPIPFIEDEPTFLRSSLRNEAW
tara:strand:+ start:299 stop:505 length:207 start_codon:yes stop_codon:yes gene_type:complete